MAKTLVTGAAGFVGSSVARLLAERGEEVRAAVDPRGSGRAGADGSGLGPEVESVRCDVRDRRAVRRALRGVDRVFHAAGLRGRLGDSPRHFAGEVAGARTLLEECLRADVGRVVYTSSAVAVGPAPPGQTADERQLFTAGRLGVPLVLAYREAEVHAIRLAARGLPVVCLNPCVVLGYGDVEGGSTALVRRFLLGQIPFYTGGAVNVVGIDDVAQGHLLAAQRGRIGERYILGNRNYTLTRLFADLSRISSVAPPAVRLPVPAALALARALERAPGGAPVTAAEIRASSRWWTYSSARARRELGWTTAPHEDAVEAAVHWYREREGERLRSGRPMRELPLRLAGTALGGAAQVSDRLRRRVA